MSAKAVQHSMLKNSLYKGLLNIFNLVIPLLTIPYIYRILDPSSVGEVEYANTIYNYFNLWGSLGLYTYGMREISKVRDNSKIVSELYGNLFSIGICSNLIAFLTLVVFNTYFFRGTSLFLILLLFGFNLISNIFYTEWINEAFEDFRFITIKTILIRLLSTVSIFVFIKTPSDVWIYVFITALATFLNYFISFVYSRRYTHFELSNFILSRSIWKKYLPPLFFILLLNNSNVLYTLLDRVMLGSLETKQDVAFYSVGQKIMEMSRSLLITLTYISLPRLSYYLRNEYSLYKEGLEKLSHVVMLLAIPMSIGLILLSRPIVYLFAGEQYSEAILPLSIFSIRLTFLMVENITSQQIMFLHGKEKNVALINIICGVVNLGLNYYLVWIGCFTPFTAVLSTLSAEMGLLYMQIRFVKKKLGIHIHFFNKTNATYLFIALLFIPIVFSFYYLVDNKYFFIILSVVVSALFYGLVLYFIKDRTFMEIYTRILNR